MICGSGGSKSRLAKAAGAEPAGQMRDEKVHAFVARSTFPSENVQNTPASDHFWKLRCRKSARRLWREAHFHVKMYKTHQLWPLLEVEMSKKCTPLWREAHFQVKMYKAHQLRTTFGSGVVEKVHAVVARSTFPSENVQNTPLSDHFWKLRCPKNARRCGAKHISKWKCTKHTMLGPLLEVEMYEKVHAVVARSTFRSQNVKNTRGFGPLLEVHMSLRFTTLHYITLHSTPLRYAPLHYTTLHNTTTTTTQLHSTTLHYTTLHSTTLHYITLHCTTFHYTSLHYTTLHYTTTTTTTTQLHSTPLHYITLH